MPYLAIKFPVEKLFSIFERSLVSSILSSGISYIGRYFIRIDFIFTIDSIWWNFPHQFRLWFERSLEMFYKQKAGDKSEIILIACNIDMFSEKTMRFSWRWHNFCPASQDLFRISFRWFPSDVLEEFKKKGKLSSVKVNTWISAHLLCSFVSLVIVSCWCSCF